MNAQLHALFMNVPVRKQVAQQKHFLILLIKGNSGQSHSKSQAIWWTGIGNWGNKDQIDPFPPLSLHTIHLSTPFPGNNSPADVFSVKATLEILILSFLEYAKPTASLTATSKPKWIYLQATSGSWLRVCEMNDAKGVVGRRLWYTTNITKTAANKFLCKCAFSVRFS